MATRISDETQKQLGSTRTMLMQGDGGIVKPVLDSQNMLTDSSSFTHTHLRWKHDGVVKLGQVGLRVEAATVKCQRKHDIISFPIPLVISGASVVDPRGQLGQIETRAKAALHKNGGTEVTDEVGVHHVEDHVILSCNRNEKIYV